MADNFFEAGHSLNLIGMGLRATLEEAIRSERVTPLLVAISPMGECSVRLCSFVCTVSSWSGWDPPPFHPDSDMPQPTVGRDIWEQL